MICPCSKKGDTSVVDSRPTEDERQLEEEDSVAVVKDSQHLKEFNLENLQ